MKTVIKIFVGSLLITLLYVVVNIYRKNTIMEDWIISLKEGLQNTLNKMTDLDDKKMFEKDDDVGELWTKIKELISKLDIFIERGNSAE